MFYSTHPSRGQTLQWFVDSLECLNVKSHVPLGGQSICATTGLWSREVFPVILIKLISRNWAVDGQFLHSSRSDS